MTNPKVTELKKSLTNGMLSNFMSAGQRSILKSLMTGEEGQHFIDMLTNLEAHLLSMPMTGEQDGMGQGAVVWLHYFRGGTDAWITERDVGDGTDDQRQHQAFGKFCLNGDRENAEMGYISIQELIENGVELDLYWTNKTLKELPT